VRPQRVQEPGLRVHVASYRKTGERRRARYSGYNRDEKQRRWPRVRRGVALGVSLHLLRPSTGWSSATVLPRTGHAADSPHRRCSGSTRSGSGRFVSSARVNQAGTPRSTGFDPKEKIATKGHPEPRELVGRGFYAWSSFMFATSDQDDLVLVVFPPRTAGADVWRC